MSWPADNKSDITRLDNANDTLGRSRREIKRGIDNVNSILDEFDINSVDAFTILQYKSGQWKPVDTTSLGMKTAIIETNLDTAANYYQLSIITSNQTYYTILDPDYFDSDAIYYTMGFSVFADMDVSDTASIAIAQSGGTSQTDINGQAIYTWFAGYLVC